MERLVSDLLRLARIDAGQEMAELAPCDVGEMLAGLIDDFEQLTREKRQIVKLSVEPAACRMVVDPPKLHDVARNLIENAIAYTPEESTIEVTARITGNKYEITVADNGPGIAAEHLSRVFERFYRVDKSRARPGGTGLGLAIVNNLVSVMQGDVAVANRPLGGAVFTVKLPIRDLP
jgi:two-component system phosphate regulon sensor histidine kinase PhoR